MVADPPAADASSDDESNTFSTFQDGGTGPGAGGDEAQPSQATDESAQTLLKQFVAPHADYAALTRTLRPTSSDYQAMFDVATAPKIEAAQAKDWDSNKAVIKPKAHQTEVKVWSCSGADLAAGKGNAKEFPEGYKKVDNPMLKATQGR